MYTRPMVLLGILALFVVISIFALLGFFWQAIDIEEFPSEKLPAWFVQRIRKPIVAFMKREGEVFPLDFGDSSSTASRNPELGDPEGSLSQFAERKEQSDSVDTENYFLIIDYQERSGPDEARESGKGGAVN